MLQGSAIDFATSYKHIDIIKQELAHIHKHDELEFGNIFKCASEKGKLIGYDITINRGVILLDLSDVDDF